jgi:hypothetical protein
MRALPLLPLAALVAVLAGCGDPTSSTPAAPLIPGRFDATFEGGLSGAGQGTAYIYDLSWASPSPLVWIELRDERVPARNTMVRFIVHGTGLLPGRHTVGGTAAVNALDAVALQFPVGAEKADVSFVGFTGTVEVEEAMAGQGLRGTFDLRSTTLRAKGRFNAVDGRF